MNVTFETDETCPCYDHDEGNELFEGNNSRNKQSNGDKLHDGIGLDHLHDKKVANINDKCTSNSSAEGSTDYTKKKSIFKEQVRVLLLFFIQKQMKNTPVEPVIHRLCQVDREAILNCGFTEKSVQDILLILNRIGDEISQNNAVEIFVQSVPLGCARDVFFDLCIKVFADGVINWGRIVTLFYVAFRLVIRCANHKGDDIMWIKQLLVWVVDFVVRYFAEWILSKGGWSTVQEWVRTFDNLWIVLFFGSLMFGIWAYYRNN